MARATAVDSIFAGTLDAGVSIGGSSCVLASTTGIDWGTTSTFAVQVGDDPLVDAELVHVTRSSDTLTLASPSTTFTKAHSAGANVYLIVSAVDLNNKASLDAANTFTLAQLFPAGTSALPGVAIGTTAYGMYQTGTALGFSTAGASRQTLSSTQAGFTVPVRPGSGSAGTPSISFTTDSSSGFFRKALNYIGISADGTEIGHMSVDDVQFLVPILVTAGIEVLGQTIEISSSPYTQLPTDPLHTDVDTSGGVIEIELKDPGSRTIPQTLYNNALWGGVDNVEISPPAGWTIDGGTAGPYIVPPGVFVRLFPEINMLDWVIETTN